jgi:hypothetical protein
LKEKQSKQEIGNAGDVFVGDIRHNESLLLDIQGINVGNSHNCSTIDVT